MRVPLLVSALLVLPLLGAAQTSELYNDARSGTLNDRYALGYFLAPRGDLPAQGSVFLVPKWLPGRLQLNGGGKPLEVPLKYDAYNLELRAKRPAGDSVSVPLARIKEFSMQDRRFVCYPASALPPDVGGGCGEVLQENAAVQLLKYERKTLEMRAAAPSSYASSSAVPVLENHTRYYLRWAANGHFAALKLRRASLVEALAGHPAALRFVEGYKGSLTTEAGMTAAIQQLAPLLGN